MQRRIVLLSGLAALALGACGRRGPLEPPPDSEQGRAWARQQERRAGNRPPEGSVRESLARDQEQAGTRDVEGDLENARTEGDPRSVSDPTRDAPGVTPSVAPAGSRRRPPGIVPPNRPFILDALLD